MTQQYRSLVGQIGQCGHILVGSITADQNALGPARHTGWLVADATAARGSEGVR
jgi:hypothetical protein